VRFCPSWGEGEPKNRKMDRRKHSVSLSVSRHSLFPFFFLFCSLFTNRGVCRSPSAARGAQPKGLPPAPLFAPPFCFEHPMKRITENTPSLSDHLSWAQWSLGVSSCPPGCFLGEGAASIHSFVFLSECVSEWMNQSDCLSQVWGITERKIAYVGSFHPRPFLVLSEKKGHQRDGTAGE